MNFREEPDLTCSKSKFDRVVIAFSPSLLIISSSMDLGNKSESFNVTKCFIAHFNESELTLIFCPPSIVDYFVLPG